MKKKIVAAMLVALTVATVSGCQKAAPAPSKATASPSPQSEIAEEKKEEAEEDMYEKHKDFYAPFEEDMNMQENGFWEDEYKVYETTSMNLKKRVDDKETFAVVVLPGDHLDKDYVKEALADIIHWATPDFSVYFIEENYAYDGQKTLCTLDPIADALNVDLESNFLKSGVYLVKDGEAFGESVHLGSYDPSMLSEEELNASRAAIKAFMAEQIGRLPSTYNFDRIITTQEEYNDVLLERGTHVVFVGTEGSDDHTQINVKKLVSSFATRCERPDGVDFVYLNLRNTLDGAIENAKGIELDSDNEDTKFLGEIYKSFSAGYGVGVVKNGVFYTYDFKENPEYKKLYDFFLDKGVVTGYKEGQEPDWDLQYSEGNPMNDIESEQSEQEEQSNQES